jgi:hypothetical protein
VAQNKAKLFKTLIITFDLEKNANFFRRKLAKIAEISDHNIDPWLPQKQIRICYFFFHQGGGKYGRFDQGPRQVSPLRINNLNQKRCPIFFALTLKTMLHQKSKLDHCGQKFLHWIVMKAMYINFNLTLVVLSVNYCHN